MPQLRSRLMMPTVAAWSCPGTLGHRVDGLGDHLDVLQFLEHGGRHRAGHRDLELHSSHVFDSHPPTITSRSRDGPTSRGRPDHPNRVGIGTRAHVRTALAREQPGGRETVLDALDQRTGQRGTQHALPHPRTADHSRTLIDAPWACSRGPWTGCTNRNPRDRQQRHSRSVFAANGALIPGATGFALFG